MASAFHKRETAIALGCTGFSIGIGIASDDPVIGSAILATGLTSAYYASIGKRVNYMLGFFNYLLTAFVSLNNSLYGIAISYTLVFAPLQIAGFFAWKTQLDDDSTVRARKFTRGKAILIVFSSIASSVALGYLLGLIPGQQLSYLDATTNCINLIGVILMIRRYEEAFWLWLCNNMLDMIIWTLMLARGGEGAFMMFAASLGFLLINLYGIAKWHRKAADADNGTKREE